MRTRTIAIWSVLILVLAGAVMAAPFAHDAMIRGTSVDRSSPVPLIDISIGGHERRVVEPLECEAGSPDKLRIYAGYCTSEHLVEIDLRSGKADLATGYHGEFRSKDGKLVRDHWQVSPTVARSLRDKLASRLPKLDREAGESVLPASEAGIEACIGGRPMIAVRHEHTEDGFSELYEELLDGTGLELASSPAQVCI
jgi:hypothetical protein